MQQAGERGQVVPLVAAVLVVAVSCALGLARWAAHEVDRSSAQAAADAAALAGAVAGEQAARAVAGANQAEVVGFATAGDVVRVEVRRRGHSAAATAEAGGGAREPPADDPAPVSSGRADGQ